MLAECVSNGALVSLGFGAGCARCLGLSRVCEQQCTVRTVRTGRKAEGSERKKGEKTGHTEWRFQK